MRTAQVARTAARTDGLVLDRGSRHTAPDAWVTASTKPPIVTAWPGTHEVSTPMVTVARPRAERIGPMIGMTRHIADRPTLIVPGLSGSPVVGAVGGRTWNGDHVEPNWLELRWYSGSVRLVREWSGASHGGGRRGAALRFSCSACHSDCAPQSPARWSWTRNGFRVFRLECLA